MYQVAITNGSITEPIHNATKSRKIKGGQITEAINSINSFVFDIYPSNNGYDALQPFSTIVKVWNSKRSRYDFIGRVLTANPQMDSSGVVYKSVVCEERLAYLCDSVQMYVALTLYEGDANRTAVQQFVDLLLDQHNALMPEHKKIYRGVVEVAPDENVYCAVEYASTWDNFNECLIDRFGGEIRLREVDGVLFLDYVERFGTNRATTIELAKNMQSARRDVDPTGIITRLIPLGAKISVTETYTDSEGNEQTTTTETEERITIADVNGGVNYIQDDTAYELHGAIYKLETWDDVTEAANLKTKAAAWLASHNRMPVTHDITALDLSLIGKDIDDFALYDSYPVKNSLIGLDTVLRIIKKVTNINEPHNSSFSMGDEAVYLSDYIMGNQTQVMALVNSYQAGNSIIASNIIASVDRKVSSAISKSESQIKASVEEETVSKSEYGEFTESVKHILQMDADGSTMLFQTINKSIQDVEGNLESQYNEIMKYIRFEDGNIILGEVGNEITLTIMNNRISFKQNGVEVAYLSDNNLYIGNAVIQSGGRLQLGNFAFVPRSDGSLSFLKVGG